MAFNLAAGVYWKEIDLSNYIPALSTTTFAVVGTASKGPINQRSLVTIPEQAVQQYGYPGASHPGLDAAFKYLEDGTQLIFVRVQSATHPAIVATADVDCDDGTPVVVNSKDPGTFYNGIVMDVAHGSPGLTSQPLTGADATGADKILTFQLTAPVVKRVLTIKRTSGASPAVAASGTLTSNNTNASDGDPVTLGTKVYTLKDTLTPTEGEVLIGIDADGTLTNLAAAINHTGTPNTDYKCAQAHPTVLSSAVVAHALALTARTAGNGGNSIVFEESATTLTATGAGHLANGVNAAAGSVVTLLADTAGSGSMTGTDVTGTVDYATGEVVLTSVNALVAEDAFLAEAQCYTTFNITLTKTIRGVASPLEKHVNMKLETTTGHYYADVMATSFLIEVPTFVAFPSVGSYTFADGNDGLTEIADADYIGIETGVTQTGLQLFASANSVDVNTVAIPGLTSDAIRQSIITLVESRRDCMGLLDPPQGLSPMQVADWINGANAYSALNSVNSSFVACYYPWVKVLDPYSATERLTPPSGFAAATYARTDKLYDSSYAPAGAARGKAKGAIGVERTLTEGEITYLYQNRVNPISDFVATGIQIWGQKTTQVAATVLDRVVARRVLNYLEKIIVTAMQPLVFEPNRPFTWARAVALVQPYLDAEVAKESLIMGKFICNEKTNTPEVIDRNEMVANCFLKLPKTAEVITVNFVLLSTGANVEEYVGRQF